MLPVPGFLVVFDDGTDKALRTPLGWCVNKVGSRRAVASVLWWTGIGMQAGRAVMVGDGTQLGMVVVLGTVVWVVLLAQMSETNESRVKPVADGWITGIRPWILGMDFVFIMLSAGRVVFVPVTLTEVWFLAGLLIGSFALFVPPPGACTASVRGWLKRLMPARPRLVPVRH